MKNEKLTVSIPARKGGKEAMREAIMDAVENGVIMSPDPYKRERISQSRGPTYQGDMRLVSSYSTDERGIKPAWQELEIWETRSGKWIAVIMGKFSNPSDTRHFTKATLLEDVRRDDLDFQIAVAESLDWTSAARAMLRKQLGWKLVVEVE